MSWEDQGRQYHMWFGHGTSGKTDDARFGRNVFGVIGHLPAASRSRWDGMLSHGMAKSVVDVLHGLSEASGPPASRFGALLPDTVGAMAADRLQAAGRAAASARTTDGERAASIALAAAVQAVGLDGWPRFVAQTGAQTGATQPAQSPTTQGAAAPKQTTVHLSEKQVRFFTTLGAKLSRFAEDLGLPKDTFWACPLTKAAGMMTTTKP